MKRILILLQLLVLLVVSVGAQESNKDFLQEQIEINSKAVKAYKYYPEKIAAAAEALEDASVVYDNKWHRLSYPMGDLEPSRGCCTDVIIRALRSGLNWDLQVSVHEYRKAQGLKLDPNNDHRRSGYLLDFLDGYFSNTHLNSKPTKNLRRGDIIVWKLAVLHYGIYLGDGKIIHNMGWGQVIEDMFAEEDVIRVYSFYPDAYEKIVEHRKNELKCLK